MKHQITMFIGKNEQPIHFELLEPDAKRFLDVIAKYERARKDSLRLEYLLGFFTPTTLAAHLKLLFVSPDKRLMLDEAIGEVPGRLEKGYQMLNRRVNNHEDGSMYANLFVAGIHLPTGDISYHLPGLMWEMLDGCGIATSLRAPHWDGHNSDDVLDRLVDWCYSPKKENLPAVGSSSPSL